MVASFAPEDRAKAERYAGIAFQGCGKPDRMVAEDGAMSIHFRQDTTEAERDYVFKTNRGRFAAKQHR